MVFFLEAKMTVLTSSVCPLVDEDKRLVQASWWEGPAVGKTGSCSVEQAMLSKSLIQLSPDRWGWPPPCQLFGLRRPSRGVCSLQGYWWPPERTCANTCLAGLLLPVPLSLWQATSSPHLLHRRPSYAHRLSLLWGHSSFHLGPDLY